MSSLANKILEIVDKYEVPQEYHDALFEAYKAGAFYGMENLSDKLIGKITAPSKPSKGGGE